MPENPHQAVVGVADDFWRLQSRWQPDLHAQVGLPVDHLPRGGHDGSIERAAEATALVSRLATVETSTLGGDDADTVRTLRFLDETYSGEAEHFHQSPAGTPYRNQFDFGIYFGTVFAPFRFEANGDVDRYLGLISQLGQRLGGLKDVLRDQADRGIYIPRPALGGAIESIAGLQRNARDLLAVDTSRLAVVDANARRALAAGIEDLVENEITPAFDRILAHLASPEYAEAAGEDVGMARLPGGEDAYRFMVRRDASADATPEELHRLGREQCADLSERMHETRSALGYDMSEADFRNVLRERAALYARSPRDVERRYLHYVSRIEPLIADYFTVLPAAPYGVARASQEVEAGLTFGYYEPPTFTEPTGRYFYNGSDLSERSLLTAAALIYHELIPGHHFHIARQFESSTIPAFRRYDATYYGAFAEGWAEYASGLAWEMGLYDDLWDAYGRLAHERFTASRLVVDTALNCGWWTYDEALAFMRANTTESDTQLRSELLRYSTDLPAQALGYRAGFLKIAALRSEAERRAGAAFDIRAFHEAVLGGGGLPLAALEQRVARELVIGRSRDHC